VTFVGRLARYQYLNMDQVVAQALSTFAACVPAYV
jgi:UDP-galactopyranose mutase